ncbi:hypothetical protein Hanom_Chr17g01548931 [Helianthus anomalus]
MDKLSYQPLFMALKPVMIEGFNGNCEPGAWFNRCSPVFFNPSFKYATEPSFTEKTFRSEVTCCHF